MKNLLLLLFCGISHSISAQYVGGLYNGKLVNDSTHKEQQYELALSEYRNEIVGYAYTTFVVHDTFYYSIKRVQAKRNGNSLEVTDVKMLRHNFPQAPDKGVRQVMHIPLPAIDTLAQVNGTWHTTATKHYYSIGGNLHLQRTQDSSGSALLAHLHDLRVTPPNSEESLPDEKTVARAPEAVSIPYTSRRQNLLQTIVTNNDSLILSFFDNGIVDGDTISVYLNQAQVIGKTKLTAAASKKVVRLSDAQQTEELMLVAENLGTIPPNTGLLVVQDGAQRHSIHFSADLQTNALIRFQRKPKP